MKATIIFDNFGPYHLARLRSVAPLCELMAVEVAGSSAEYAWERKIDVGSQNTETSAGFEIVTLFQHGTSVDAKQQELSQKIDNAFNGFCPQVVFIPGWSSRAAFAALNWCVCHSIPAVMMSESTEWDEDRSAWREAIKQRVVGLCSAALVGGHPHKDYMVKLGVPCERVFLGYDTVDNDYFAIHAEESRNQEEKFRKKYKLPLNYFLASARFIEKKNLPRLLEAYAKYRSYINKAKELDAKTQKAAVLSSYPNKKEDVPWDLVLLGDGDLRTSILNIRSSFGLDDCVHLPGFVQYPDLPTYYSLARAFIHASTTEQWGLVVNEAMASGLPVLVSNRCGCARDLVQEGVNGFTFNPHDVEQLAHLMIKIWDVNFPLSVFGNASHEIISDWRSERFASGVKAAGDCAMEVDSKPVGIFDRNLLNLLVRL